MPERKKLICPVYFLTTRQQRKQTVLNYFYVRFLPQPVPFIRVKNTGARRFR